MKRTVPLLIAAVSGLILIVSYFVPAMSELQEEVVKWFNILAAVAFILGGASLFKVQLKAISDREAGWGYSAIILLSFLISLGFGLFKVGVSPDWNAEYAGEVWEPVAEADLPVEVPPGADTVRVSENLLYRPEFSTLAATGPLNDAERRVATESSETFSQAVSRLIPRADRVTSVGPVSVTGAMSIEERDRLLANPPGIAVTFGPPPGIAESLGELNAEQRDVLAGFDWHGFSEDDLMRAIPQAGAGDAADVTPPDPVEFDAEDLRGSYAAGTLIRDTAPPGFLDDKPLRAERSLELAYELLKAGPLMDEQRSLLIDPARELRAARNAVRAAFVQSQQVKFGWTARYDSEGSAFWWCYEYLFQPLTATIFAMLAFYLSSAAFRAFRAKNLDATILLGTALVVLLTVTFIGTALSGLFEPTGLTQYLRLDKIKSIVMGVFVTSGNRAIMIGIALGIAATSLKVILGIDRSYLGKD